MIKPDTRLAWLVERWATKLLKPYGYSWLCDKRCPTYISFCAIGDPCEFDCIALWWHTNASGKFTPNRERPTTWESGYAAPTILPESESLYSSSNGEWVPLVKVCPWYTVSLEVRHVIRLLVKGSPFLGSGFPRPLRDRFLKVERVKPSSVITVWEQLKVTTIASWGWMNGATIAGMCVVCAFRRVRDGEVMEWCRIKRMDQIKCFSSFSGWIDFQQVTTEGEDNLLLRVY